MPSTPRLKDPYVPSKCCGPQPDDPITGYYSHDGTLIKVHKSDCSNLDKADQSRLVILEWTDILAEAAFKPDKDYYELDQLDWRVMQHHREYGVDYSLKMARMLYADKQAVFDSHKKLRAMKILERVEPLIIQYRKGIVDNKWIKHRNHTYYDLTDKGNKYLDYHLASES